jgi:aminopeptidase N
MVYGQQYRFKFSQKVSIHSYLVAIVVADITSLPISERCSVWAEQADVKAAAWEFAQVSGYCYYYHALYGHQAMFEYTTQNSHISKKAKTL